MPTAWIVPTLDEFKDGHARGGRGPEAHPLGQLTFQGPEEALAHGVLVGGQLPPVPLIQRRF